MWKLLLRSEAKGTPGVYESLVAKALGQRKRRVRCVAGASGRACLSVGTPSHALGLSPYMMPELAGWQASGQTSSESGPAAPHGGSTCLRPAEQPGLPAVSHAAAGQDACLAWHASSTDWNMQIEKDLHRTFPGHPVMDASGRSALRRVLAAYSRRNPDVGYCQVRSCTVVVLLAAQRPDGSSQSVGACTDICVPAGHELCGRLPAAIHGRGGRVLEPGSHCGGSAAWLLFSADAGAPGTGLCFERLDASPQQALCTRRIVGWRLGAQVDQLVFKHLVEASFPRLAAHLDKLGAHVAGVSTQWFLCLFVNSLPLETCLRVWDLFFLEQCASSLFRVALALVDIYAQARSAATLPNAACCDLHAMRGPRCAGECHAQALLATVDSVDAFSLLQNMAPMSFDSSRLIDIACIAYAQVCEHRLHSLCTGVRVAPQRNASHGVPACVRLGDEHACHGAHDGGAKSAAIRWADPSCR